MGCYQSPYGLASLTNHDFRGHGIRSYKTPRLCPSFLGFVYCLTTYWCFGYGGNPCRSHLRFRYFWPYSRLRSLQRLRFGFTYSYNLSLWSR